MMDYQKKKMLTQSVALIQSHLTLTSDTLEVFKAADVLTSEEVSTIEVSAFCPLRYLIIFPNDMDTWLFCGLCFRKMR